jgi:hypothetical protein
MPDPFRPILTPTSPFQRSAGIGSLGAVQVNVQISLEGALVDLAAGEE